MKVTMVISAQMSAEQLERSYLLGLALLNFEHNLSLVFIDQAFTKLTLTPVNKKRWLALKLYGVNNFYQLNTVVHSNNAIQADKHCEVISSATFNDLKSQMDLLL